MNTQPPEAFGSGKDLPCGWKDGKQAGFWKEQRGRVVPGSLNTFRDKGVLRSNPGNPGTPGSASFTTPREIPWLRQTHLKQTTPAKVVLKSWFSSNQLVITQFIPEQSCLAADGVSSPRNTPAVACSGQRDELTLALGMSLGLWCCSLCSRRGVLSSAASPQPQT